MLIDSHVNLHAPQFDADREAVISRSLAAGVRLMVNICDRVSNFPAVRQVAQHPDIWCTVGTHPHEAKENPSLAAATLVELARDPRVVGIGECGLDFHYDLSPRDIQARSSASTSPPRGRPGCRWWSTRARPTRRWARSCGRSTPAARSGC
jgi:TatD DNase family protein